MRTPTIFCAGCDNGRSPIDRAFVFDREPARELTLVHADLPAWFMPARFAEPSALGFDEAGAPGAVT